MVGQWLPAVAASLAGTLHHRQKVAVLRIIQHLGQWPGQPVVIAISIDVANALEGRVVLNSDAFVSHGDVPGFQRLAREHGLEAD